MTANDFAAKIYDLMGWGNYPPREEDRTVSVAVVRAHYGVPSAALIEFEGSPPHCRVAVQGLETCAFLWAIVIDGRLLKYGSRRHERAGAILQEFLKTYLEQQHVLEQREQFPVWP